MHLCFRDGTQLSDGVAFFENLFTEEAAKRIICIYRGPRPVNKDDGTNVTHYKAFSAEGRKALFKTLGYHPENTDDDTDKLTEMFFEKRLVLTALNDALDDENREEQAVKESEGRALARILFEFNPSAFTENCFLNIKPTSVMFPSYQTYGEQQADGLKRVSEKGNDLKTTLQWADGLTCGELESLNESFSKNESSSKESSTICRQLVVQGNESIRFETFKQRTERWKNNKVYTPEIMDCVFVWPNQLKEDLEKMKHDEAVSYFAELLPKYIEKKDNSWMYNGTAVKVIDVRGLENYVFDKNCTFRDCVIKTYPGIAFRTEKEQSGDKDMEVISSTDSIGKYWDCVATEAKKQEWNNKRLPELKGERLRDYVHDSDGEPRFKEGELKALVKDKKCSAKDFILLLSERDINKINFSEDEFSQEKFDDIFKNGGDVTHFGLLGKAHLWIPRKYENYFKSGQFVRDEYDDKGDFLSVSVLPQSVGIQFIKEEIETEDEKRNLSVTRLVWNAYAEYLFDCALRSKETTSYWIFAHRIAEAAKEQKLKRVCVDLSNRNEGAAVTDLLVTALSERGIDVLVNKGLMSPECIDGLKNKGKDSARGVYKTDRNDIWFLPGADLELEQNQKAADKQKRVWFAEKDKQLRIIQESTKDDIELSEELLSLATVEEIFNALEKNSTEGTVTIRWRKDHPLQNALSAWARTYCGSKGKDKQQPMNRCIKLVSEKENAEEENAEKFFPETLEADVMEGNFSGRFGCLCDSEEGTVTFVSIKDYFSKKEEEKVNWIKKNNTRNFVVYKYDWDCTKGFFEKLIAARMAPDQTGFGNITFYTIPDLDTLLGKIKEHVSKPRGERSDNLIIRFEAGLKMDQKSFEDFLKEYPARISYETRDGGTVKSIILKSRSNYLLDMVGKNGGKLSLVKEDIIENGASLGEVLEKALGKGLQELVVPAGALEELSTRDEDKFKSIFLSAVEYMLCNIKGEQSVKVTCENPDVIKKLLDAYGNNGMRRYFFIKDKPEETCCRTISRETFFEKHRESLLNKIKNNENDKEGFRISTLDTDAKTLLELCQQLNTEKAKGHLIASGFDGGVVEKTIRKILQAGVQRSWDLIFERTKFRSMERLVKDMGMKKGWALDCAPSSKEELSVVFYPPNAKEELSEKILKIFEDKFEKEKDSYQVLPQYWKLGTASVLQAADNPDSQVTQLVFDVDDKEASETLASGIKEFCQEVLVKRNDWQIKVNFGNNSDRRSAFKDALQEYKINDKQQRILSTKEKCESATSQFLYSLIVETLSPEDYFVRDINLDSKGEKKNSEDRYLSHLGRRWGELSIENTLKYLSSPENKGTVFYDEKHNKPEFEKLKGAVELVLKSEKGRTGWMISFKNPVILTKEGAQALLALNKEKDVKRYIIPCGKRTLLFVNRAMYDLWQKELRQSNELKVTKELTAQTDGFLPILFAASLRSSSVKELNVAKEVAIPPDVFGWNPFKNVIKERPYLTKLMPK